MIATLPNSEQARLEALRRYDILDTVPEEAFDDLVRLAAHVCAVPVALISLCDERRQWFKAKVGLNFSQSPREASLTPHILAQTEILVVPDTLADPRFAASPCVTDGCAVRFYAGAPLVTPDGYVLGALCVLDHMPRTLTPAQADSLSAMARQVMAHLELRRIRAGHERPGQGKKNYLDLFQFASEGIFQTAPDGRYLSANNALARIYRYDSPEALMAELRAGGLYADAGRREEFTRLMQEHDAVSDFESQIRRRDGGLIWISESARAVRDEQGDIVCFEGMVTDITERRRAEEALRESEARYRGLVEFSPEAVAVYCDDQLVYVNAATVRLIGASGPEDLLGRPISDFIHPDSLPVAQERAQLCQCAGAASPLTELRYVRLDGRVIEVDAVSTPITWEGRPAGQVLVRDITERKRAEEALRSSEQQLRAVVAGAPLILFSLDADGVFTFSEGRGLNALGLRPDQIVGRPVFEVFRDHRPLLENIRRALAGETVASMLEVNGTVFETLLSPQHNNGGELVGAVGVATDVTERQWAESEILSLNSQLEHRLDSIEQLNRELSEAYDSTIEGWSRALDLRDHETEGHSLRVTDITVALARAFGMSEEELTQVRRGALLHDIGKMGVPDAVLRKPGPLTDEEWVLMRRHPTYAYEMLSAIPFVRPALDIPYCHHEKWDGTGYPRGLRGEEIPLAARLFAVVDVWDALRSDRPYRPAWSAEKTRDHIRVLAGSHFDPQAVEAFLEMFAGDCGTLPMSTLLAV